MSGIDRHASVHPLCLGWAGLGLGWSVQPLKLYVEQTTIAGAADVASLLPIPLLLPLPFAFALPIYPLPSLGGRQCILQCVGVGTVCGNLMQFVNI